jgi:phosphate-selective porin OprO and OprP
MTTLVKNQKWLATILLAAQVMATTATADETSDEIELLKKQIQALTQKVERLEQQHNEEIARQTNAPLAAPAPRESSSPAASPTNAPFITAGADGFSLQSADQDFILRLSGFAQVDGRDYLSVAPGAYGTFTIRRMRAIASGSVYHDFEYYMQVDFGALNTATTTNDSFLQDAYVNIHHWDAFQVEAGKFKEPVSLEVLPLDQYLWFLERGFPTELAPNRDVGVDIHGNLWHGALVYAAGAFNGVPDGGSGDIEVADNDKDAVARVIAAPFKNTRIDALQNFAFGLGGSYGLQAGSTTPTFGTVGRQIFFKYGPTVTETGQHLRLDPQASYYWGPFCAYGEYAFSDEEFHLPAGKGKNAYFLNKGWDVDASWYLTGESNIFGVLPTVLHPFRFDGSGWGAFQLAARFGQLSLDPNAFPLYAASGSAQGATSWSVALDWYLNHNVKCIFEYSQTAFSGASHAAGSVSAQDERALLGRLQFGF